MASFPWNGSSSRTTGISASDNFANGSGLLSDEIDNTTNLDTMMDIQLGFDPESAPAAGASFYIYILYAPESAPAAGASFYIYILYALDGTNYEDGGTSLQPTAKTPAATIACRAVDTAQKVNADQIMISPHKFKILVWNATVVQHDAVTLLARTYRGGYAA